MSIDPVTALASGVNSSIKILEVTYQLKAVGEQTTDLLRTTEHVDRNVNEARRLRRLKTALISNDERIWMDRVIEDTERALREVAHLIEPARVDVMTQDSVKSWNRILWVFRDSPKVRDKHNRLSICHQSLMTVVGGLYAKDVVVITPMEGTRKEEQPPPYSPEMEAILNWRKKRTKSLASVKSSDVTTSPPFSIPSSPTISQHSSLSLTDVRLLEPSQDTFAKEALDIYHQARLSFTEPVRPSPLPYSAATSDTVPTLGHHIPEASALRSPMELGNTSHSARTYPQPHQHPLASHPPQVPTLFPTPSVPELSASPTISEPFDVAAMMGSLPSLTNSSVNEYRVSDAEMESTRALQYYGGLEALEASQATRRAELPPLPTSYAPSRRRDRSWLAYTVARSDIGHSTG
ncbi:uncharacterized protein KY384_007959 [Bacidia gigantensis]|uniref:uncharacterized protein n=1 Tax=Bacidia gigantensis TaxID=2732470 RepID=UPI001D037576|nr:uncharacterized protein KY384_007959 [Bacidia gigantensis]KAG8527805.1 hypothetical protein KY384_007959 [Bacidia gigantensis]